MDSSLATQLVDKMPRLKFAHGFFRKLETVAIRNSIGVLAVCEALYKIAKPHNNNVKLLSDVAMLDQLQVGPEVTDLASQFRLASTRIMYIGNLESYQGIDLLIEGFAIALKTTSDLSLIVIGGSSNSIEHYQNKCQQLTISDAVYFAGPKPFNDIAAYMSQVDILASPRIQGENTPMKIYNYMASGKAIIATDIYSHTQVLNSSISELVAAKPESMAVAIAKLAESPSYRKEMGDRCKAYAEANYSVASFETAVKEFYADLQEKLHSVSA
jgi:glycosyltransferase involved in cell wall biosynthesis